MPPKSSNTRESKGSSIAEDKKQSELYEHNEDEREVHEEVQKRRRFVASIPSGDAVIRSWKNGDPPNLDDIEMAVSHRRQLEKINEFRKNNIQSFKEKKKKGESITPCEKVIAEDLLAQQKDLAMEVSAKITASEMAAHFISNRSSYRGNDVSKDVPVFKHNSCIVRTVNNISQDDKRMRSENAHEKMRGGKRKNKRRKPREDDEEEVEEVEEEEVEEEEVEEDEEEEEKVEEKKEGKKSVTRFNMEQTDQAGVKETKAYVNSILQNGKKNVKGIRRFTQQHDMDLAEYDEVIKDFAFPVEKKYIRDGGETSIGMFKKVNDIKDGSTVVPDFVPYSKKDAALRSQIPLSSKRNELFDTTDEEEEEDLEEEEEEEEEEASIHSKNELEEIINAVEAIKDSIDTSVREELAVKHGATAALGAYSKTSRDMLGTGRANGHSTSDNLKLSKTNDEDSIVSDVIKIFSDLLEKQIKENGLRFSNPDLLHILASSIPENKTLRDMITVSKNKSKIITAIVTVMFNSFSVTDYAESIARKESELKETITQRNIRGLMVLADNMRKDVEHLSLHGLEKVEDADKASFRAVYDPSVSTRREIACRISGDVSSEIKTVPSFVSVDLRVANGVVHSANAIVHSNDSSVSFAVTSRELNDYAVADATLHFVSATGKKYGASSIPLISVEYLEQMMIVPVNPDAILCVYGKSCIAVRNSIQSEVPKAPLQAFTFPGENWMLQLAEIVEYERDLRVRKGQAGVKTSHISDEKFRMLETMYAESGSESTLASSTDNSLRVNVYNVKRCVLEYHRRKCVMCIMFHVLHRFNDGKPTDCAIHPFIVPVGPGGFAASALLLPPTNDCEFRGIVGPFPAFRETSLSLVHYTDPDTSFQTSMYKFKDLNFQPASAGTAVRGL